MQVKVQPRDVAKDLFLKGLKPKEISKQVGKSETVIRQWAHRGEWAILRETSTIPKLTAEDLDCQQVAKAFVQKTYDEAMRLLIRLQKTKPAKVRDIKDAAVALSSIAATGRKALGLDSERTKRDSLAWRARLSHNIS